MASKAKHNMLIAIVVLALIGVVLSIFLTITHYTGTPGDTCAKTKEGVPTCDLVNQSIYSEIMGIPVALLAIFVYGAYAIMAWSIKKKNGLFGLKAKHLHWGLVSLSGVSMLFVIYFLYILYMVLGTYCLFCLMAHMTTLAIFVLSLILLRKK